MSVSTEYVEYICDLLIDFPDLQTKKFFGGVALRATPFSVSEIDDNSPNDTQFAMIQNDVLYFVVDDITRQRYEAKGMQAFNYNKKMEL